MACAGDPEHDSAPGKRDQQECLTTAKNCWHVRALDVVCRYGGDEFVVVMPETPLEDANAKARQLLSALHALQMPEVDFSMGVASLPEHGECSVSLLESVDDALYRAKELGGGRVIGAA
jgi:diguanylate cyclase (GGDEF)-like protein